MLEFIVYAAVAVVALRMLGRAAAPRRQPVSVIVIREREGIPAGSFAPGENAALRFAAVADYHGHGEDDLIRLRASCWRRFASLFVGATLLAGYTIACLRNLSAITGGFLTVALMAKAAEASLGHWQIRTRRLGGWVEFLASPGQWLPPSEADMRRAPAVRVPGMGIRWHAASLAAAVRWMPFRARVAVRRAWRWLVPARVPPAPQGTPLLTYTPSAILPLGGRNHG